MIVLVVQYFYVTFFKSKFKSPVFIYAYREVPLQISAERMQPPIRDGKVSNAFGVVQCRQLNAQLSRVFCLNTLFRPLAKELLKSFVLERSNHALSVMCNVTVCNTALRVEGKPMLSLCPEKRHPQGRP